MFPADMNYIFFVIFLAEFSVFQLKTVHSTLIIDSTDPVPVSFWPVSSSTHGETKDTSVLYATLHDASLETETEKTGKTTETTEYVKLSGQSSSYIDITNDGRLNGTTSFTWLFSVFTNVSQKAVLLEYSGNGNGPGIRVELSGVDFVAQIYDESGMFVTSVTIPDFLDLAEWNFVGFSYVSDWKTVYLIKESKAEGFQISKDIFKINALGNVRIGSSVSATSSFSGYIDCVQFYDKALLETALKSAPGYCDSDHSIKTPDWTRTYTPPSTNTSVEETTTTGSVNDTTTVATNITTTTTNFTIVINETTTDASETEKLTTTTTSTKAEQSMTSATTTTTTDESEIRKVTTTTTINTAAEQSTTSATTTTNLTIPNNKTSTDESETTTTLTTTDTKKPSIDLTVKPFKTAATTTTTMKPLSTTTTEINTTTAWRTASKVIDTNLTTTSTQTTTIYSANETIEITNSTTTAAKTATTSKSDPEERPTFTTTTTTSFYNYTSSIFSPTGAVTVLTNAEDCHISSTTQLTNQSGVICICHRIQATSDVYGVRLLAENSSKELVLDRKNLAKYKRLFYSVPDYRPSSVGLGTSSVILLIVLVAFVTSTDVIQTLRWMFVKLRKLCHL